jgi:hypothetical protein
VLCIVLLLPDRVALFSQYPLDALADADRALEEAAAVPGGGNAVMTFVGPDSVEIIRRVGPESWRVFTDEGLHDAIRRVSAPPGESPGIVPRPVQPTERTPPCSQF